MAEDESSETLVVQGGVEDEPGAVDESIPANAAEVDRPGADPDTPEWADFQAADFSAVTGTGFEPGSEGEMDRPQGSEAPEVGSGRAGSGTPADSNADTMGSQETTSVASSPTAAEAPVVAAPPVRTTSLPRTPAIETARTANTSSPKRGSKARSSVDAAPASATQKPPSARAKELFVLNKWMLSELEEQERFSRGKIRDWTRVHRDVERRLAMARRDQVKLSRIAAGAELPATPGAGKSRKLERGAAVFARWPLGGDRDLGDLGAIEDDEAAMWHFGLYLGPDPFSEDLARIKFLFPAASEAGKRPAGKAAAQERRPSSSTQTAYPAPSAKLAPVQSSSSVQTLVFPGKDIDSDGEDQFSWVLSVATKDVVEASWLRPGDRVRFFEGAQSLNVRVEARKASGSMSVAPSNLFDPSAAPFGIGFLQMTLEERLIAERPSLAYTPYIIAGPVVIRSSPPEEDVRGKASSPVDSAPSKKAGKGAVPSAAELPPPSSPVSGPAAVYHVPLTVIPEGRYAQFEAALNDMADPESNVERAAIDAKFLLRGDRPSNLRELRPTPFLVGTAVVDDHTAAAMQARSRGKGVKSALEMVFSGPFGANVGMGKWSASSPAK
ncbi:hypothetical protein DFJ74DRAFT_664680 [Hyaloraphidium curvatum]|nr:hypothetical protein DFJ74DRAFT_664680 [Hyaloraphidium curvatum]